jgi:hypothetical protein
MIEGAIKLIWTGRGPVFVTGTGPQLDGPGRVADHKAAEKRVGRHLASWLTNGTASVAYTLAGRVDVRETVINVLLDIAAHPDDWPPTRDLGDLLAASGLPVSEGYLKKRRMEARRQWSRHERRRQIREANAKHHEIVRQFMNR